MLDLQDSLRTTNAKIIEAALEASQGEMTEIAMNSFNEASDEFGKWQEGNMDTPVGDKFRKFQEILLAHMFKGMADGFQKGYIAGMNTAFDIVEAKSMELSGPPEHIN